MTARSLGAARKLIVLPHAASGGSPEWQAAGRHAGGRLQSRRQLRPRRGEISQSPDLVGPWSKPDNSACADTRLIEETCLAAPREH